MTADRDRSARPWPLLALGLIVAVIIALAISEIGVPSSQARVTREVVSAQDGVVQSSVSGSGNVEAGIDQAVNFQTSGTLATVNVTVGEHVSQGQLIATLDPAAAELALDAAEFNLKAAQDNLASAESGSSTTSGTQASYSGDSHAEFVSDVTTATVPGAATATTPSSPSTTTTAGPSRAPTTTVPSSAQPKVVTVTVASTTPTAARSSAASGSASGSGGSSSSASSSPSPASIASAQAQVDTAQADVDSAEKALAETRLYAPVSGTIASLSSDTPGDAVSASGGSSSGASASSGSSSASGGSVAAGSLGGSSSSSSSSSGFAEIVNAGSLTMTLALSESDINSVRVGQAATVSIDALSGVELGAHVTAVAPIGTSSGGVVSYDATLTLDQRNSKVRPGMSATATVITGQASGVTVPNQALSGSGSTATVDVLSNGKTVSRQVVVGMRGSSRSQVVSGLSAGQQVVVTMRLPALGTSTSSSSSSGTLGGFGGAGPFGGGAGAFRGGGAGLRALLGGG